MVLTASAIVALTVPIAAKITGAVDRLNVALSAATLVLEHPQSPTLSINQSQAGLGLGAVLSDDANLAAKKYDIVKTWPHTFMFFSISADRLLGLLTQTMGKLDLATAHFQDALTFCRNGGYRQELAWACHDFSSMLLERGDQADRTKINEMIYESLAIATEFGMNPLVARAAATQERAIAEPTAYPDGLTVREVEVTRLVAEGKTDRGIAEELIISPNTVSNHVRSILGKTDSANRTESAAYAV